MARLRDYVIAGAAATEAAHLWRRGWTARVTSSIAIYSLRRGMRSGSPAWLYLAAATNMLRIAQRVLAPKPDVMRLTLRPGESLEIREYPPPQ